MSILIPWLFEVVELIVTNRAPLILFFHFDHLDFTN